MVNVVLDKILLQLLKNQNGYTPEFSLFVQIPIQVFQVSRVCMGEALQGKEKMTIVTIVFWQKICLQWYLQRVKFYLLAML